MSSKENTKSYSEEEITNLRNRLQVIKNEKSLSWAALSQLTGIAEGTVSQWVTGSYQGNMSAVAAKVEIFFNTYATRQTMLAVDASAVPAFLPTKVSEMVNTVLSWAHMGNMTTVTGAPGVGKSFALVEYPKRNSNAWMITARPSNSSVIGTLGEIVMAMRLPTRVNGVAPAQISNQLIDHLTNRPCVIIIDEAQELAPIAIREVRALHDATGCGIVFTGNEDVLSAGMAKGKNAQLWSRNATRLHIDKPLPEDVAMLLDAWKVSGKREREFLTAIAMRPGGGALRSMTKTLQMASMAANGEGVERAFTHIERASIHLGYRPLSARAA